MEPLPIIPLLKIWGNMPATFDSYQMFLYPYLPQLIILCWFFWILVLIYMIRYVIKKGVRD